MPAFLLLGIMLPYLVLAEQGDSTARYHFSVPYPCFYEEFSRPWVDEEGQALSFPIEREATQALTLTYEFEGDSIWPSDLYLYVERVAWEAELSLNGQYLQLHQQPFEPILLALDTSWFQVGTNRLSLSLRPGVLLPNAPKPILGLWGKAGLIQATEWETWQPKVPVRVESADTVAIIAPSYRFASPQYVFDTFVAMRNFLPVLEAGIKHVYFVYPPDIQTRSLAAALGLTEVESLKAETQVAMINTYPAAAQVLEQVPTFWLTEHGSRSIYYGDVSLWGGGKTQTEGVNAPWLLMMLILFPLMGLFFIKWTNPAFYYSFAAMLFQPKRFADVNSVVSLSSGGWVFVYTLIKGLIQACWLALGIYYIQLSQQWSSLSSWLGTESLLLDFFPGNDSLGLLALKGGGIILVWQVLRLLLTGMIGQVFGIKTFAVRTMALDLLASLPILFGLALPFVVGIFWGDSLPWFNVFSLGLFAIYFARKAYTVYIGLDRSFGFSTGMKILYICTFNIIPYLLWV